MLDHNLALFRSLLYSLKGKAELISSTATTGACEHSRRVHFKEDEIHGNFEEDIADHQPQQVLLTEDGPGIDEDDYAPELQVHKKIEDANDDCGDNISSIHYQEEVHNEKTPENIMVTTEEYMLEEVINHEFVNHYLWGSSMESITTTPPGTIVTYDPMSMLEALEAFSWSGPRIDVMEIFGGEAGVSRLLIRRHYRVGANYDLVCGYDLSQPTHVQSMWRYIHRHRPSVIIAACVFGPPSGRPAV